MKKILSMIAGCSLIAGCITPVFAESAQERKQAATLGYNQYKTGDYSYTSNVANLCLGTGYGGGYWNYDTSKQLVIKHDKNKYPDLSQKSASFDEIHKTYMDTMNNIMNCAILKSKYTLHKKIITNFKVSEKAKKVFQEANTIIEKQIQEQKCIAPREADKIYNAKDLLDSMSYEQCVYHMYVFYYKQFCGTGLGSCLGTKLTRAGDIADKSRTQRNKLQDEQEISDLALETALSLYENFERTYISHALLELIEVELTESKRYIGVTIKALQQFISVADVQKSEKKR